MSRKLVPQKIEELCVPGTNEKLILYLDRNEMTFFCDVHGVKHRNSSYSTLREEMVNVAQHLVILTWTDIIEVIVPSDNNRAWSINNKNDTKAELDFMIARYHAAVNDLGKWIKSTWGVPVEERAHNWTSIYWDGDRPKSGLELPIHTHNGHHFLLHTEELWLGLNQIKTQVDAMRERLQMFLRSEKSEETISKVGSQVMAMMLTSGGKNGDKS